MESMVKEANKNILDLINFDLTTFYIGGEYKEVNTEDTPAILIVDYEKKLEEKEFDLFDTLRFRVLFDKSNITGETHINATFRSKKKRITKEEAKLFVNYIQNYFGLDNETKGSWNEQDDIDFENYELNRIWSSGLGDNFISVSNKEVSGLELHILFLNNLLRNLDKKLLF